MVLHRFLVFTFFLEFFFLLVFFSLTSNHFHPKLLKHLVFLLKSYSQSIKVFKFKFSKVHFTRSNSINPYEEISHLTFMRLMLSVTVVFFTLTSGASNLFMSFGYF